MAIVLEEVEGVPQRWIDLKVDKLVKDGWRPRIKKRGKKKYLTIRLGNDEKSIGEATEENVGLFADLFPSFHGVLFRTEDQEPPPQKAKIMATPVKRPAEIGTSYRPSLEVLQWYTWAKGKGFTGTLEDFINQSISSYFEDKGWRLAVVKGVFE